jgi:hypothetical protein
MTHLPPGKIPLAKESILACRISVKQKGKISSAKIVLIVENKQIPCKNPQAENGIV